MTFDSQDNQQFIGVVPPYSDEAEKAVLGAILLDNANAGEVFSVIDDGAFYVEANRRIFQTMLQLSKNGRPIDAITVGISLRESGELDNIGGAKIFSRLTENLILRVSAREYAEIVKSYYVRRRMIQTAQKIIADGFAQITDLNEYISNASSAISEISAQMITGHGPVHIDDEVQAIWNELQSGDDPVGMIKTGIPSFDSEVGGLFPGEMVIVAARPGMGKSTFVLNIAANVMLQGKKVLFVTLEDVRRTTVSRLIARFADIDLSTIKLRRAMSKDEWTRFINAANMLVGKKPLWIEDGSRLTSTTIRQILLTHKAQKGLDLVIIDHLGEIADKGEKFDVLSDAASLFRDCAKEMKIPLVLVSQLNRDVERREDKIPRLSDLRGSGNLEQVARVIVFPYRPGYYKPDGNTRRDLQCIVAKNSNGNTGMIRMYCDPSRMYVTDWDVSQHGLFPGDTDEVMARVNAASRENQKEEDLPHGRDYDRRNYY